MQKQRRLLKSAGVVSGATALSRILGLTRDVLTARFFGTSFVYDAFVVAFMIPNFLRSLLGEGALNAAFIPVFSSYLAKNQRKQAFYMANVVLSVVGCLLGGLALLVMVATQIYLGVFDVSYKTQLTLRLLQVMSPYMIFICLAALMMGVLNAHRHFAVPSLAPVILNICWIIALIYVCPLFGADLGDQVFGLALGVVVAGVLQLAIQVPIARSYGFRISRMAFNVKHQGVRDVCRLMIPVVIAFTVNQINVMVDIILAHLLGEGMQSSLWYAQRIIYFPLGVFGVAMSVAIMPTLSLLAARNHLDEMKETLAYGLRAVLMIMGPCAVAIVALHHEMISLFYARGAFGATSVQQTSLALVCYGVGLVAFAGNKVLVPAYYSLKDTKTPVRIGLWCVAANLILNLALMGPLKQGGLALATSLSSLLNMVLLFRGLRWTLGEWKGNGLWLCLIKVAGVGLAFAAVARITLYGVRLMALDGVLAQVVEVFVPLMAGFVAAGLCYLGLGMSELFLLFHKPSRGESA